MSRKPDKEKFEFNSEDLLPPDEVSIIPEVALALGVDFIGDKIKEGLSDDEPFAEEKAAERKAKEKEKEKKKTTKEFGEW